MYIIIDHCEQNSSTTDVPRMGTEAQDEQTLPQRWKQCILLLALARRDLSLFTVCRS